MTMVVHSSENDGAPFLFCSVKRLGKMPSRAANRGIWPSMSIQTSHEDSTEMMTPTFTITAPQAPNFCSMMAAMDGSAMPAISPCVNTPSGSSETST